MPLISIHQHSETPADCHRKSVQMNDDIQQFQLIFLCLKFGKPSHSLQSRHEAIFTAPSDDEPMEALKSSANRPTWNCETACFILRADDWILRVARSKENAVVDPLSLDELELPSKMRSDKREH